MGTARPASQGRIIIGQRGPGAKPDLKVVRATRRPAQRRSGRCTLSRLRARIHRGKRMPVGVSRASGRFDPTPLPPLAAPSETACTAAYSGGRPERESRFADRPLSPWPAAGSKRLEAAPPRPARPRARAPRANARRSALPVVYSLQRVKWSFGMRVSWANPGWQAGQTTPREPRPRASA